MIEEEHLPDFVQPDNSKSTRLDSFEEHLQPEMRLGPGERYGWWEDHDADGNRNVAAVHGAVNNVRTDILLDSGASVSMLSLDLARRLKLKLKFGKQLRVTGLGGVPTIITASTEVKITLGPRVVYVMELWVANIGEGVDALLGMNFMYSAGVRLCVREGLVQLPDEETVLLAGRGASHRGRGLDVAVQPAQSMYLQPGEHVIVRIRHGQSDPRREVVWAGRGDRWVTQIVYASKGWPVAVKVVNISKRLVWIDTRTAVARIIEHGFFPRDGRFVRPGLRRYREWETLIYESTNSAQVRLRKERQAQALRDAEPPCVQTPDYAWPSKLLTRPVPGTGTVRMVRLQDKPRQLEVAPAARCPESVEKPSLNEEVQMETFPNTDSVDDEAEEESPRDAPAEDDVGVEDLSTEEPACDLDGELDSDGDEFFDSITVDDNFDPTGDFTPSDDFEDDERLDLPTCAMPCTPLHQLEMEYERVMKVNAEELQLEPAVCIHEGSELMAQLRDQLTMIPELQDLSPKCDIDSADVGVPGESTPAGEKKLRAILKYHRTIFLGDGNAAPAPARGVICDLDVGDAKPVAQRPRSIAPRLAVKVYELLMKLLETGLIELSESPWASPIVIVLKKNGVDIRMCIDYRVVNGFIQLSNYPLRLIDDLLIGFEKAMWFMSLDMASGFWAIRMSERAKLISAFVCPFGHFQWVRMPFGLKNAPLVCQAVINNCPWGFVRLPPEEESEVDQDVLDFLRLDPTVQPDKVVETETSESRLPVLSEGMTVFKRNIPTPSHMGPVLGRSSYIDDIAHGAETWDQLCEDLNALLFRLRYWNISVSLQKSEFGKRVIPYLSHEISAEGIRATPKIAKGVEGLPFPSTLKGVQSFLGSLNYYHKFIEDFPVVAAVVYELSDEQVRSGRNLSRAKEAFGLLKRKIVSTPLLRHPDRTRPFVIIPHANQWAACAVLGQEYDGVIQPVRYTGRVLNDAELRYHIAEKEVIAILRVLQVFRTLIEGCPIVVYTRYSVLKWVIQSKSADGRCVPRGLALSHWDLEIRKVKRDEDGLAAIMGAGITPREHLDEVAESLIPTKGLVQMPPLVSIEMLPLDFDGVLLSFDGAAKTSTRQGSCGCILWKLPEWTILEARGFILNDVTVNDAEYHGLLKGLSMASARKIDDLIAVGDSRIVQGLINCNQPHLQKHLASVDALKAEFKSLRLVHLKRDFNQAADYLTTRTLLLGESWKVQDETELAHLRQVSKIAAKLMTQDSPNAESSDGQSPKDAFGSQSPKEDPADAVLPDAASSPLPHAAKVMAVLTRSADRDADDPTAAPMGPLEFQAERWRRIKAHQEEDEYLSGIIAFLKGDFGRFSPRQLRKVAKVADLFVLDTRDILYRLARSTRGRPRDFVDEPRLVVPKDLREDMTHYAHEDYQGGHQGVTRTFEKLRLEFYWPGMYSDVKRWVEECVDCASGKGRPPNAGPSPGNIEPRRPFELVSMDFVTHMPKSARGNTFLLLFQDSFSGFIMCKPMSLTTAQEVAEAYEECVFRRFGASSMIRHDQDPRFMSEVFTRFRELFGSRQRATLAYRPQANGQQERSVQTVVRSIRAYIAEADQSDWDDHAERLMFALNTSFDATRLDTPFYLVNGWDAQSTISAMLGPKPSSVQERTAYEWRRKLQRDYSYALACAEDLQNKSKRHRSEVQTEKWRQLSERLKAGFEKGDSVWLYIPKVQTGLSRKLAHLWHGPFRIEEVRDDFRFKLKIADTGYRVNPWVHISRLKPRALSPRRPTAEIEVAEDDGFDTALLPEDSWEPDPERNEYEVEKLLDLRWSKRTRTSKRRREYLVKWKGYEEPEWIPLDQLSCGTLLYEFNRSARARARFQSMQAGDDHPRA